MRIHYTCIQSVPLFAVRHCFDKSYRTNIFLPNHFFGTHDIDPDTCRTTAGRSRGGQGHGSRRRSHRHTGRQPVTGQAKPELMPWRCRLAEPRMHAQSPPPPPACCIATLTQLLACWAAHDCHVRAAQKGVVVLGLAKSVFADVGQLLEQPADRRPARSRRPSA